MIKFFRRIRQKLLSENKFSKYLLYAIGEIALVMIGILLALQVNNWNEEYKDRALSMNYLQRIRSEIEKDTTILNEKIALSDKLIKDYLNFIREMYKTQNNTKDFIELLISAELNVDGLILTDIAYSEMVNTGKLDLIVNSDLKENIVAYYRHYKFVSSRVNELNESSLAAIQAAESTAPKLKYVATEFSKRYFANESYMFPDSDWSYINSPNSLEFRLLENAIYYYHMKQVLMNEYLSELNTDAKAVIGYLSKELTEH